VTGERLYSRSEVRSARKLAIGKSHVFRATRLAATSAPEMIIWFRWRAPRLLLLHRLTSKETTLRSRKNPVSER
jgi:hypothetical protein